jgi:putative spermidine/putrescine transport system ATP-binding protein
MASVDLEHVTVGTGRARRLSAVTMSIADGAFVAVVGASGSGKTSLLRAVAGLDRVDSGVVRIGDRDVTSMAPGQRDVGMVFQTAALLGHLSTRRNVSFPLDVRRLAAADIRQRVDAEVRALHIEGLMDRDPSTLSAGEQQMVQIARALVRVPNVLLLDEPFAALDDSLRRNLRAEISMLQAGYGVTTVMATNDSEDVQALASSVAVLDQGVLVQWGPTADVRRAPSTLLAAAVTGPMSIVDMTVLAERDGFWLVREDPAGGEFVRVRAWSPALEGHVGGKVRMVIRPEDAVVSGAGSVPALVERPSPVQVGGVQCVVAGTRVIASAGGARSPSPGDRVRLRLDRVLLFDPTTDAAIA